MIQRYISTYINKLSASYPVVTLMGPRQSGKTTLAKALFPHHEYRNLEAEDIRVIAKADPRAFLHQGNARMVIDEIQRFPDLLTYIQEIVDERKMKGQFRKHGCRRGFETPSEPRTGTRFVVLPEFLRID